MRRAKRLGLFVAVVAIALILCAFLPACTSEKYDMAAEYGKGGADDSGAGEDMIVTTTDRMMVYYVDLYVTVKNVDDAEREIYTKLAEVGGYSESVYKSDYRTTLTVRVPTGKLDEFVANVKGKGTVDDYSVSGVDITEKYTTSVAKRDALIAEKERLETLLEDPELTVTDRLAIDKRIFEIASQIDVYTTDVATYKKQAEYSTVTVTLYKEYEEEEKTFWESLGEVLSGSAGSIGKVFGWLVVVIVAIAPYVGVVAVGFGLYVLIKFIVCKAKKKKFGLFVQARANAAKRRERREEIRREFEEKRQKAKEGNK